MSDKDLGENRGGQLGKNHPLGNGIPNGDYVGKVRRDGSEGGKRHPNKEEKNMFAETGGGRGRGVV